MAVPTLVATVGGATANAYCTVAEGNTYHDAHLYASDWTDADTDTKTIALIMATRLLDAQFAWTGSVTDTVTPQALRWPRIGMYNRDDTVFDSDVLPQALKDATAEYARTLIAENLTADSDVAKQGLSAFTAGSISLTFKGSVAARPIPDAVFALLVPSWGGQAGRASSGAVTMERG